MTLAIPNDVAALFGGKILIGYLSTRRPDAHLSVVPVAVVIHEGLIRISTHADTFKVRNLKHDPHIAVCVPDPKDPRRYVMIRGTAEVADDTDRSFINWMARVHMGREEYPEAPDVARMVITLRPAKFTMSGARE